MIIATLTTTDLTVVESVVVAVLDVDTVGLVTSPVNVIVVSGHEEALDLVWTEGGIALGELVKVRRAIQATAYVATTRGCCTRLARHLRNLGKSLIYN